MTLEELVGQVDGFDALPPRNKIRLFAWWLHTQGGVETFGCAAIRSCYKQLYMQPDAVATYVSYMAKKLCPPDLIKERSGYKLARAVRTELDAKYGVHQSVVQVSKLLAGLPGKSPDIAERNFLTEAIKCYQVEAFRLYVVIT